MLDRGPHGDGTPIAQDGVGMLARGDLIAVVHNANATLTRSRWLFTTFDEIATDEMTYLVLLIIGGVGKPPDQAIRDFEASAYARVAPKLRRVVVITDGSGFRNSLVRLVLSAYTRLSRNKGLFAFADDLERALSLLQDKKSPDTPSSAQLMSDLQSLRSAVRAHPGSSLAPG